MIRSTRSLIAFALLITIATGCDFLGGNSSDKDPVDAYIGFIGEGITPTAPLVAPDTAQAGQAFDVTVTTFGFSSCVQAVREEVERAPMRTTITPYDGGNGHQTACTWVIAEMPRTISVTFREPGMGTIAVNGRDRLWTNNLDKLVTLTHTVIVE
ncbi:hypothetical protein CRI93_10560 [Longimonas halophila]|uniref:Lipoprotein n=1 Tax=Longimonas halophila TaxID=1469170 RepID=A0A2H3NK58_9BACT|nr:hypothetical protein [Longimonas halophila]PEN06257.1 hypothetical protein CRI93_10560 [Longimonas halophila]